MKKVLILFTILLISCGSENGTAELDYPAEEVTGAEEKSEEVVCLLYTSPSPRD